MQRFRNVLVVAPPGVDMTGAMREAEHLASTNSAAVTVFDAVAPIRMRTGLRGSGPDAQAIQSLIETGRRSELEMVAALAPSIDVEIATAIGSTFIEAIRRIVIHGHDLVIISPDQEADAPGLMRASTTMHLLRKSPVPVWVHRPQATGSPDVLAAVGPFEEDGPSALDRKLLELSSSLAARRGGTLHIVHGWHLEGETLLRRGRIQLPADQVDALVAEASENAATGMAKLLASTGLDPAAAQIHVLNAKPVAAIARVAAEVSPGITVMGTVARSGIAGLIMGNTAETTLGTLSSSVLAVKPDGFESPVTF